MHRPKNVLPVSAYHWPIFIYNAGARSIFKVSGHQHWWLAGGYDLEMRYFWRWIAWWIVAFFAVCSHQEKMMADVGHHFADKCF